MIKKEKVTEKQGQKITTKPDIDTYHRFHSKRYHPFEDITPEIKKKILGKNEKHTKDFIELELDIDFLCDNYLLPKEGKSTIPWEDVTDDIYKRVKGKFRIYRKAEKKKKLRKMVIDAHEEAVLDRIINERSIYCFAGYAFIFMAQQQRLRQNNKDLVKGTGMNKVRIYIHYANKWKLLARRGQIVKTVRLNNASYGDNLLKSALKSGHKYPTYEERIDEINTYLKDRLDSYFKENPEKKEAEIKRNREYGRRYVKRQAAFFERRRLIKEKQNG